MTQEQDRHNKDVLRHSFDIYRDGMRPFLVRMLKKVPSLTLEDAIRQSLKGRSLESFEYAISKGDDIEETFDIGEFPELIRHHWHRVFREYFDEYTEVAHDTRQLRTIRNYLAHGKLKDLGMVATVEYLSLMTKVLGSINEPSEKAKIEGEIDALSVEKEAERVENLDLIVSGEDGSTEMVSSSDEAGDEAPEVAGQEVQDDAEAELSAGIHIFKVSWISERESPRSGQPYFRVDFAHITTGEMVFRNYSLQPQSIPYLAILMDEFGVDTEGLESVLDNLEARSQVYKRLLSAIRGKTVSLQLVRHEWEGGTRFHPERVMNPDPSPPTTPGITEIPTQKHRLTANSDDLPF